jgi:hypothetical protein
MFTSICRPPSLANSDLRRALEQLLLAVYRMRVVRKDAGVQQPVYLARLQILRGSCFSLIASYRRFTSCNVKSYPSRDNSNRQAEMSAGPISLIAIVMPRSLIPICRYSLGPEARGTNPRRATNRSHPPGGYHGAATSRQFHDPGESGCKSVAYRRITRALEIDESRPV